MSNFKVGGDFNKDGYDDIVIGLMERQSFPVGSSAAATSYIIYGRSRANWTQRADQL